MDKNRRTFLKIMCIGGGALVADKVLGPLLSKFAQNQPFVSRVRKKSTGFASESSTKNNLLSGGNISRSFRIFEDEEILSISDSSGEEIFQIDKRA